MLVSEEEALERLGSPLNLINRMKTITTSTRNNSMNLFGINRDSKDNRQGSSHPISQALVPHSFNPFPKPATELPRTAPDEPEPEPPRIDNLLDNADNKIKLAHAHDTALGLLTDAVSMMKTKLDDIKPEKIPAVIGAASKVVESIRRERIEASKAKQGREVHYHFYTPERKKLTDYEVIDVSPQANQ